MEENIAHERMFMNEYRFIAGLWRKIFSKKVIQIQCFGTEVCKDISKYKMQNFMELWEIAVFILNVKYKSNMNAMKTKYQ